MKIEIGDNLADTLKRFGGWIKDIDGFVLYFIVIAIIGGFVGTCGVGS